MTGEYINRVWLAQNIRMDMSAADVAKVIENAPVVEFDPDEPPARGRCRSCKHYKGNTCYYWPGFVSGDDWCSNYTRPEPPKEET